MDVVTKPLAEITQDALRILYKEMGIVNTLRFVSQFTVGYGNYTEEREQLFGDMSLDDMVAEIKDSRSRTTSA